MRINSRITFLGRSLDRWRHTFLAIALLAVLSIFARRAQAQSMMAASPVDAALHEHARAIDIIWTLLAGFLVMFMQAGFALVETGMCRAKNVAHTMSMNLMVYALSMMGFYMFGFAFMMGGVNAAHAGSSAPLIGGPASLDLATVGKLSQMLSVTIAGKQWGLCGFSGFFLNGLTKSPGAMVLFFYMMVFMDTAATIPTGSLAERWRFKSFTIFSFLVGAVLYSGYGCWMWGGGWLASLGVNAGLGHGAVDFAGSSVVHLQGGMLSLITTIMIGPRIGKFDVDGNARPIFGHHMPMVILGTFILAFGWFGFNAGSGLSGTSDRIALIAVNTMLASGGGCTAACIYIWKMYGKPDPSLLSNGMLGGLVAITASCAFVTPGCALLIGIFGGLLAVWGVLFVERRGIDDPVGAISVHGFAGIWGLLAVGLFADGTYGDGYNHVVGNVTGVFYGDHRFGQLLSQIIAGVVCIGWNLTAGGVAFLLIGRWLGSNRVRPEVEIAGLDIPEMGAPGYPEFITHLSHEQVAVSEFQLGSRRAF